MLGSIAKKRHARLEKQQSVLIADLHNFPNGPNSDEIESFTHPVKRTAERVEKRRIEFENASVSQKPEYFDHYVSGLDDYEKRIFVLQKLTSYLELYSTQTENNSDLMDEVQQVCDEICNLMGLPITTYPIMREEFAIDTFQEHISGYCGLIFPREDNFTKHQAIIGHELGHPLFQRRHIPPQFLDDIWDIDDGWGGYAGEFANIWERWYQELFCDGCGVLSFGPCFIYAQTEQLHWANPFEIKQTHPPRAMRLHFIRKLGKEILPEKAKQDLTTHWEGVDRYLNNQERNKNQLYDAYYYEHLLDQIVTRMEDEIPNELDRVMEWTHSNTELSEVPDDIHHRVRINREWIQNGG